MAASVTRLKTPELIRNNSNAKAEVAAVNRCARFPAFTARRAPNGVGCPSGLAAYKAIAEAGPSARLSPFRELRLADSQAVTVKVGELEMPRDRCLLDLDAELFGYGFRV